MFRALLEESAERARARVREARRRAASLEQFVGGAYRAYFDFLASDPQTFELVRRNSGTIRTHFAEAAFGLGVEELEQDLRAGIAAGVVPKLDAGYMAAAMVGAGFEIGVRMVASAPADVEGATRLASELFLGGIERLRA